MIEYHIFRKYHAIFSYHLNIKKFIILFIYFLFFKLSMLKFVDCIQTVKFINFKLIDQRCIAYMQ